MLYHVQNKSAELSEPTIRMAIQFKLVRIRIFHRPRVSVIEVRREVGVSERLWV